jgi:DNA-binding NtrC family response regulator
LPLVDHLLRRACESLGRRVPALETELSRFLERFDWPENIRQLRDCIETMLVLNGSDLLTLEDIPARIDDPAQPGAGMYFPMGLSLAELERSAIEQALARSDGNRTRAADRLGISVRTLQRKLKSWSLEGLETDPAQQREG